MDASQSILSDITIFSKYAKYIPELNRRETWGEICDRYENMLIEKYPALTLQITHHMKQIREKQVLPSMRAMQFAGEPIKKNHARIYNCAYLPIDDYRSFSETMFLLLGGTGVGYSVQYQHVTHLPAITKPTKSRKYLIGDSIEGWADAVKALMKAYFGMNHSLPLFDYSDIRPKGARLITAGGKAPGPEPLKECLFKVQQILDRKKDGEKLRPIEVHDILCHIANAVLAGGIRRAAMISLFSAEDIEMLTCKSGAWWELNEQRGRANNSAVLERGKVTLSQFKKLWKIIELSNAGEPGIYWTSDTDYGTNPCCEISLRPYQFCNLTDVNVSNVTSQEELNYRVNVAAFFGTLQAGFTDFHYLRNCWKENTEKDALIAVGMTGIGSGNILKLDLEEASNEAKNMNTQIASVIHINQAARVTTIKPSGTTSLVLGTSSGIHAWHSEYYLRSIRVGKNESLYSYMKKNFSVLVEDEFFRSDTQAVIRIPQRAPEGAILRTESALEFLERVKKFNLDWVRKGHRSGPNSNNVSATVSIDSDRFYLPTYGGEFTEFEEVWEDKVEGMISEWGAVGIWMWENKETFNGLSVLPFDNGTYIQAPFEDITKEQFEELSKEIHSIDMTQVLENEDNTDQSGEAACAGGACSL